MIVSVSGRAVVRCERLSFTDCLPEECSAASFVENANRGKHEQVATKSHPLKYIMREINSANRLLCIPALSDGPAFDAASSTLFSSIQKTCLPPKKIWTSYWCLLSQLTYETIERNFSLLFRLKTCYVLEMVLDLTQVLG